MDVQTYCMMQKWKRIFRDEREGGMEGRGMGGGEREGKERVRGRGGEYRGLACVKTVNTNLLLRFGPVEEPCSALIFLANLILPFL